MSEDRMMARALALGPDFTTAPTTRRIRPLPTPAAEHPMRCPATCPPVIPEDHEHTCIHPARRTDQTIGIPEHQCRCGLTWTERKAALEDDDKRPLAVRIADEYEAFKKGENR